MNILTNLKVGSKLLYRVKKPFKKFRECKVVYIFKAYKIPKKKKVIKYYGENIINPKYNRIFGPMNYDRLVLKFGKNNYAIIHRNVKTLNFVEINDLKY